MTKEHKYKWAEAHEIAVEIVEELRPFCDRIEIAGSIRRKKPEVSDIEIVAIPRPYSVGIFEDGLAKIVNQWQKVKGELEFGKTKYTQRILPSGIKLDLFFAIEENWGLIFGIRTGSAEYSHKVLARGWVRNGYRSEEGCLSNEDERFEVREEKDLFRMAGVTYTEPENREINNLNN